jgi:tripartite-type tricarboxylate transporter receptor subunit TctC
VAYYTELLRKVTTTPEWKEYIERNALKETFAAGGDFLKFLEKDDAYHQALMKEAGFFAAK